VGRHHSAPLTRRSRADVPNRAADDECDLRPANDSSPVHTAGPLRGGSPPRAADFVRRRPAQPSYSLAGSRHWRGRTDRTGSHPHGRAAQNGVHTGSSGIRTEASVRSVLCPRNPNVLKNRNASRICRCAGVRPPSRQQVAAHQEAAGAGPQPRGATCPCWGSQPPGAAGSRTESADFPLPRGSID
jgi:hypothetical protein